MGEAVLFWTAAPLMVLAALGLLFAKRAVHVAMAVVLVMTGLAFLYFSLGAPFLGVVQIVVYTGAVMMLFVFVLMLVGVDRSEEVRESRSGYRLIALVTAGGAAATLIYVISRTTLDFGPALPDDRSHPEAVAEVLFGRYVVLMEVLAILLITAAVGALVLTHVPQLRRRMTQAELQSTRVAEGLNPVNKPMPGVYARRNALDIPALGPDGEPVPDSVSRVLKAREQTTEGEKYRAVPAPEDES